MALNHCSGVRQEKLRFVGECGANCIKGKKKLGFIHGALAKPELKEDQDVSECHACDVPHSMICLWILNIIEPRLQPSVAYVKKPRRCGNILKNGMAWPILQKYIK